MAIVMLDVEAAVVEWPQERRNRLENRLRVSQRLTDIPDNLLAVLQGREAFPKLTQAIIDAYEEKAEPKAKVRELVTAVNQPNAFGDYDETARQVVLALASVAAFRTSPTPAMWEYLWSLAWHSAALESFLPQAVVAAATETTFQRQFFAVARGVVEEAAQNPGRRAIEREKNMGANLRKRWKKDRQLSELWRGRYEHSYRPVGRDDDNVLSIVAAIDAAEFVQLLALYDYPDPVAHALFYFGVPWHFDRWRAVASVAPAAFEESGKWNGSLILPLLLSIARQQFQFELGREPTSTQISNATNDIKNLAAEVAQVIAQRADVVGCMTRWGNWLVRAAIPAVSANQIPHPTDAASQGFIEDALLEALIDISPVWSAEPAPNAEPWEPWCQLAASALSALARNGAMPSAEGFLDEWHIGPDQWPGERGQNLKLHAIPFTGGGPRADGYGARLLALPMVEVDRIDEEWKGFWNATTTLREVVEFGDSDEADDGGWKGRADAGRLLMLQFSIGLMMLDHLIWPPRRLECDRSSAIKNLFPRLDEAVREMGAIDQLNGEFWCEAVRHLAIRRSVWLSSPAAPAGIALSAEVNPTLVDFIRTLAGDTENLLALAYVAQRNGVDNGVLVDAFKAAEIDISAEITLAERWLEMSPRRTTLNKEHLDVVRKLLPNTPIG